MRVLLALLAIVATLAPDLGDRAARLASGDLGLLSPHEATLPAGWDVAFSEPATAESSEDASDDDPPLLHASRRGNGPIFGPLPAPTGETLPVRRLALAQPATGPPAA